jgi:hypothetical protein
MFFAKSPRGVKGFRKNCLGGSPYFGFYCIFNKKCFEICLRGVLYLPSPFPYLTPPVCIYENNLSDKLGFDQKLFVGQYVIRTKVVNLKIIFF